MKYEDYLEVQTLNGLLSIQDLGRKESQHLGFSVGGCADEFAYLFANKLIHSNANPNSENTYLDINTLNQPTLEITLGQVSLKANRACIIAITGADCNATINQRPIKNWQVHQLNVNDIIEFSMPKSGLHSYLAIDGGLKLAIDAPKWLGSYSQTFNERTLDDSANVITTKTKFYSSVEKKYPTFTKPQILAQSGVNKATNPVNFYPHHKLTLRFIPSTLYSTLSLKQQQTFLEQVYQISPNSNRMGYRLLPHDVSIKSTKSILAENDRSAHTLSAPTSFGMIQLPQNEQPIILMKERQTIGGYPVLGCVIQTDLFRLCQMRAGEKVKFVPLSIEKAQQQLSSFYQRFTN